MGNSSYEKAIRLDFIFNKTKPLVLFCDKKSTHLGNPHKMIFKISLALVLRH